MKTPTYFLLLFICLISFYACENSDDLDSPSNTSATIKSGDKISNVLSIDEFNWIDGLNSWKQASKDRLWTSTFSFRSGNEFTYSFDFDGVAFNLIGEYFEDANDGYTFYGSRITNNGAGSGTQTLVTGTIEVRNDGQFIIDMKYGASNNTSAIVNHSSFLLNTYKRFDCIMTME